MILLIPHLKVCQSYMLVSRHLLQEESRCSHECGNAKARNLSSCACIWHRAWCRGHCTIGGRAVCSIRRATTTHELEVGACDPGGVGSVNHHALVTEECWACRIGAQERIHVLRHEACLSYIAVLASEIANLACIWSGDVARVVFAAVGRVEVAYSCAAIAIGRDREFVDMVYERSVIRLQREAGEIDGHHDSTTARGR
jgi:hypothetical protein